jgi:hypothetical protein
MVQPDFPPDDPNMVYPFSSSDDEEEDQLQSDDEEEQHHQHPYESLIVYATPNKNNKKKKDGKQKNMNKIEERISDASQLKPKERKKRKKVDVSTSRSSSSLSEEEKKTPAIYSLTAASTSSSSSLLSKEDKDDESGPNTTNEYKKNPTDIMTRKDDEASSSVASSSEDPIEKNKEESAQVFKQKKHDKWRIHAKKTLDSQQTTKKGQTRRLKDQPPENSKDVKDGTQKRQVILAITHTKNCQHLSTFPLKDREDYPSTQYTFMVKDEVLKNPQYISSGGRVWREIPHVSLLVPPGTDRKEYGKDLVSIGKLLQDEELDDDDPELTVELSAGEGTVLFEDIFGPNKPNSRGMK